MLMASQVKEWGIRDSVHKILAAWDHHKIQGKDPVNVPITAKKIPDGGILRIMVVRATDQINSVNIIT